MNYLACHYALRRLGVSPLAAVVGSLVFSFALPVTAQIGHAQLHYRFGVPLATALFALFLESRDWRQLVAAAFWVVWQFFCSIYIGFFLLMLLAAMLAVFVLRLLRRTSDDRRAEWCKFTRAWLDLPGATRLRLLIVTFFLASLMGVLFYPYISVTLLYGAKRSLGGIAGLLPRLQSYFLRTPLCFGRRSRRFLLVFQCGRSIRCSSALYR